MKPTLLSFTSLLIYLGLILAPLGISTHLGLPNRPWMDQASTNLGMLAFNIILLEFWSTGRIKVISQLLGIDWVLQVHQLFARTAVLLLVAHPFMYSLPGRPSYSPGPANESYLGLSSNSLITGLIALIVLGIMVGLAITRNKSESKYETWRATHAIMAIAVALLGFHHTVHAGRFAQEPNMHLYWQIALGLALLSIAWVYVVRPVMQSMNAYQVVSIKEKSHHIWELVIQHSRNKIASYKPGQFAWLKIGSAAPLYENPFSIASCANSQSSQMTFLIKDIGDFTHQVTELKAGDKIYVDAPYGNFGHGIFSNQTDEIVLIAGGVGIAPIASLLGEIAKNAQVKFTNKKIVLIYGNRITEQIVDIQQMVNLSSLNKFELIHVITEPNATWKGLTGVLDKVSLEKILKSSGINTQTAQFFVCGPAVMIDSVENALAELGVNLGQIDSEKFQYDFSQKNARNRLSLGSWLIATGTLIASAIYWVNR
jgi:predicted ferric reductase